MTTSTARPGRPYKDWFGDAACFLGALFIGGVASDATDVATSSFAATNDLLGLVAALALFWRRRFPVAVSLVAAAISLVSPLAGGAAVLSVFSVAAYRPTRVALAVAAIHVAPSVVYVSPYPDQDLTRWQSVVAGIVLAFAALGWGIVVRSRRELIESLAERAERAEADQHARIEEARTAERHRIAGEMHDVLAHRLSLLSLHAGALELRRDATPDELARAAAVIRSNAHLALDDLRAVVGVLRTDMSTTAPQPTIDSLPALIEETRSAGTPVDLEDAVVDRAGVPPDVGRHAYRVVQEGLTNARKHAPNRPVTVWIAGNPTDGLTIEVTNPVDTTETGGGPAGPVGPGGPSGPGGPGGPSGPGGAGGGDRPDAIPGGGVGLIGLVERVGVAGGRLEHGIDRTGVHRLRAWLPWTT